MCWGNVKSVSVQLSSESTLKYGFNAAHGNKCVAEWTNGQGPLWCCVDDEVWRHRSDVAWLLSLNISLHVSGSDIQLLQNPLVLGRTRALTACHVLCVTLRPSVSSESISMVSLSESWIVTSGTFDPSPAPTPLLLEGGGGCPWVSSVYLVQQPVSSSFSCPDMNSQCVWSKK